MIDLKLKIRPTKIVSSNDKETKVGEIDVRVYKELIQALEEAKALIKNEVICQSHGDKLELTSFEIDLINDKSFRSWLSRYFPDTRKEG